MEEETSSKDVDKHKTEPDVLGDSDNLSSSKEENILPPNRTESESALLEHHSESSHHRNVTSSSERNNISLQDKEMAKADDTILCSASSALTKRTLERDEQNPETKLRVLLLETIPSGDIEFDPLSIVNGDLKEHDEGEAKLEQCDRSSNVYDSRTALPTEQSIKPNVSLTSSSSKKQTPLAVDSVSQNSSSRTTPANQPKSRKKNVKDDSSSGRWTAEEHREFLRGLQIHGREWKKVATLIPSRSSAQVRSHAQKYFVRLQRMQDEDQERNGDYNQSLGSREECASTCSSTLQHSIRVEDVSMSSIPLSVRLQAERILSQPETVQAEVNQTLERLRVRYRQLQERLRQREQASTLNNEVSTVAVDNESVGAGSIESLHQEELIALHVLQGGLASTNESESESDTMVSTTKMNEAIDPKADYPSTKRRRLG